MTKKSSLFSTLEKIFEPVVVASELPLKYFQYTCYVVVLSLLYIGNVHYHDRILRKIDGLSEEVKKCSFDYTILEAEYYKVIQPNELVKKLEYLGIEKNTTPPYKLDSHHTSR